MISVLLSFSRGRRLPCLLFSCFESQLLLSLGMIDGDDWWFQTILNFLKILHTHSLKCQGIWMGIEGKISLLPPLTLSPMVFLSRSNQCLHFTSSPSWNYIILDKIGGLCCGSKLSPNSQRLNTTKVFFLHQTIYWSCMTLWSCHLSMWLPGKRELEGCTGAVLSYWDSPWSELITWST